MTHEKMPEALRLAQELDAYHTMACHKLAAMELRRQHAEIERLRAENDVLCDALSSYIMFKNDAHILEGNFHWLPNGESVEEILSSALQSTKEQP